MEMQCYFVETLRVGAKEVSSIRIFMGIEADYPKPIVKIIIETRNY